MENKKLLILMCLVFLLAAETLLSQEGPGLNEASKSGLQRILESKFPALDDKLIETVLSVPREFFIPENFKKYAYDDISIPGDNSVKVISYSDLLLVLSAIKNTEKGKALIIGKNTGFAASAITNFYETIYLVELNVSEKTGFESYYNEKYPAIIAEFTVDMDYFNPEAPYDMIFFNVALEKFSDRYVKLLSENGEIIFPMRDRDGIQQLYRVEKNGESFEITSIGEVFFPDF